MHIEVSEAGDPAHREAILKPLAAYNRIMTGRMDAGVNLVLILRDELGAVIGGMAGSGFYDWFKLELAYVPEAMRGQGRGAAMLARIEHAAAARGWHGLWLHSHGVHSHEAQAPGFYQLRGYRVVGTLPDRPPGHADLFLAKRLGQNAIVTDTFDLPAVLEVSVADETARSDHAALLQLVVASTDAHSVALPWNLPWGQLALLVRDDEGQCQGGLWGQLSQGWLCVDLLGLTPEARAHGTGRRLMALAEDWALAKGCLGVYLDTFSFQARPFYEKLGYQLFGQIDTYPDQHSRFFLSKRIAR